MQEMIQYIKSRLSGLYPGSEIKAMTKIIATDVFHFNILDYYAGKDIKLSEEHRDILHKIVARLVCHEPLQYIIGEAWFHGSTFKVNRNVLIPRPETAELVDCILSDNTEEGLKILDAGTGSGCIAITLSLNMPTAQVEAWDISEAALEVAKGNAQRLHADISFKQMDLLRCTLPPDTKWDIIASNPPYVTEKEKSAMDANVLGWEPGIALFVPDSTPLLFYEAIGKLGLNHLPPGGKLYFEINQMFGKETARLLQDLGYVQIKVVKDLYNNDRIVTAIR